MKILFYVSIYPFSICYISYWKYKFLWIIMRSYNCVGTNAQIQLRWYECAETNARKCTSWYVTRKTTFLDLWWNYRVKEYRQLDKLEKNGLVLFWISGREILYLCLYTWYSVVKSKYNLNVYILERECYEIFKEYFVVNFISRKYMSIFYLLYFLLKI